LSKGKAGSDRTSQKTPNLDRRQGKFRQAKPKNTLSCPKARQVQTGQAKKHLILSEGKASSDRLSPKTPNLG